MFTVMPLGSINESVNDDSSPQEITHVPNTITPEAIQITALHDLSTEITTTIITVDMEPIAVNEDQLESP